MKNLSLKYLFFLLLLLNEIAFGQFFFFGRNKVQYDDFEWKMLKTKHFNVYYYGEFEEFAKIGANYAEEAYEELKVKFNHVVVSQIPLIFYNTHLHFQQTNTTPGFIPEGVGGFFEFLKGRVVIPYLGSLEQFRHVIRHELVHVFMTSKVLNSQRDHRIRIQKLPPLWFVEGLAEYWSYYWDTQADMILRDAVLNGIFANLRNFRRIRGSFLMYKEGQDFLGFVSREYGEDKILKIMENFWRFPNFDDVLEYTLEEPFERIDEKWEYDVRRRYFPLYKDKAPHHINSKKITNSGFNFSPHHVVVNSIDYIYFIGNHDGYSSIYRVQFDPWHDEYLPVEKMVQGEKSGEFEAFHLFKSSMTISSDRILAFITKKEGTDAIHFYSIDEDEVIDQFQSNEIITIEAPKYSPDGTKLIFSGIDRKGFVDLFILDVKTKIIERVTNDYYSDRDPVFNEDGSKVIFTSDRTGGEYYQKFNLYEIELDSREIKFLTHFNGNVLTPEYSEDYSKIYFSADQDGTNNIYQLEIDENDNPKGMTQLTHFVTGVFDFDIIDENKIVTSAFERFSFQFYYLDLDEVEDSVKKYTEFSFDEVGRGWIPQKITGEYEFQSLEHEREYSLDYAVTQIIADPVYGARGGAIFSLTDMLGDDRFIFLIYNTAQVQSEFLRSFNVAISKINMKKRTNYGFGVFNYNGRRYDISQSDRYFYERSFGGYFSLFYPLSMFKRFELNVVLANSEKEFELEFVPVKSLLLSNTVSFVHDNSLWGPTGPLDGSRFRFLVGYTSDIKYSNENYYSVIMDYRKYFRLTQRSAVATRAALFFNHGKRARRYFGGGSWDIRGWPRWSIRGEKMWVSSVELRFPLLDNFYFGFPFFGINFPNLRGALYFDAGSAWDDKYISTLGSLGVGFRFNLFNAIVFRYDIGKKIEKDFTQFQPRWFYQFFFGWDF